MPVDNNAGHQMPESEQTTEPAPPPYVADPEEMPGDSVCWLRMVCPECGAMAEGDPAANCPQCGAPRDTDR